MRVPIGEQYGFGVRLAYGLTGWQRTEDTAKKAYNVGRWTTKGYRDTWNWAGEGDDDTRTLKAIPAFFGFVLLVIPLVISGVMYVVSPFAASSYGELDATFHWEPSEDPKIGPYIKAASASPRTCIPTPRASTAAWGPTSGRATASSP